MNNAQFKIKYHLLQSDSSEEEELEKDLVSIKFYPEQTVQIKYSQLCKHSKLIRNKYLISDVRTKLSKDIQKFQQEKKIDSNNIKSFLQLLQDEDIEMTNDKYFDFYKLSEFFQIKKLTKNLNKYFRENVKDVDFIIQFILNQENPENPQFELEAPMEDTLIYHVDELLKNENIKKLPVSLIYRILEKCNEIPNGELFDLILSSISTFYVFFGFIDLQKLSDDQFGMLLKSYANSNSEFKKFFQYLPCNLNFLNELKKKVIQLEADNLQLQNKLKTSENIQSQLIDAQSKSDGFQLQINNLNSENFQLKEKVKNLETKNNDLLSQLNHLKNECDELQKRCKKCESMDDDKEEDLFDPFATEKNIKNHSSLGSLQDILAVTKNNNSKNNINWFSFGVQQQANKNDSFGQLQDPFPVDNNNNNNKSNENWFPFGAQKQANSNNDDQFEVIEEEENNDNIQSFQDQFEVIEEEEMNDIFRSLKDPFPVDEKRNENLFPFGGNINNNNDKFAFLQDPFPTVSNNDSNNSFQNLSFHVKAPGNYFAFSEGNQSSDPFGTPKEEKDDLFQSSTDHLHAASNKLRSLHDPFEAIEKSNANFGSLQDPFPVDNNYNNQIKNNENWFPFGEQKQANINDKFASLQDPFPTADSNDSSNQFQNQAFFGSEYYSDPFTKY